MLAVLMMIAVAIAGSLVTYAWIMGYIDLSTERSAEAITIPSIANDPTNNDLLVYVQNIGEGVAQLEEDECLYINGILVPCTISGVTVSDNRATLAQGETATLRYSGEPFLSEEKMKVKVTTLRGTFADKTAQPSPVLDHFEFDPIPSPQHTWEHFNFTIRAIDQYGNLFKGYIGWVFLRYQDGDTRFTCYTNRSFVGGIWENGATLSTAYDTEVTITIECQSDPSKNGTSNTFEVISVDEYPFEVWN